MGQRQPREDRLTEPIAGSTLAELRDRFESALQPGPKGYFSGGAADEVTLAANCSAWRNWEIHPRVLVNVADRDPSVELLGSRRPHPLIAAPTAYHRLAHPRGEPETARGCERAGAIYTLSTLATARPAEVAAGCEEGTKWFQVYVFKDRAVTADLVAEAVDNGFEALVLTADLPVLGKRERDRRTGFAIGDANLVPGVSAAGASGLISMQDTADLIDPSLTWRDVERLAADSPLPVLVKGILHPADAQAAISSGAAGVVVSNHGGRQLDNVPATASVLESVVEAVDGSGAVIVDGGIRRGTDVLVALSLGADSVMLGRPVLWGLAAAGAAGVEAAFAAVLDEFDRALALSGCPKASELKGRNDLVVPKLRLSD
ncbi:MAG: alpha-hydroxy acid oxidase [Actinomycetes bacterium]